MTRLLLFILMFTAFAGPAAAWVVRDKLTDFYESASHELFALRKIRHNEQLNEEQTVWEIYWNAQPQRALMVVGFKDGKFAHHWEWKDGLNAYPRRNELLPAYDLVTQNGDDAPPFPEDQLKDIINKKMKMSPVDPSPDCGATLTKDATGYTLRVGNDSRKLPWVHANNDGTAFKRTITRCYQGKAGVYGVVIEMSGTVTAPAEDGAPKKSYPNFSTETFIWTKEPPKS